MVAILRRTKIGGKGILVFLFLLTLYACCLIWTMPDKSIWMDEAARMLMALGNAGVVNEMPSDVVLTMRGDLLGADRVQVQDFIANFSYDPFPPLYFLGMRALSAVFEPSLLFFRYISLFFTLLTAGLLFLYAEQGSGKRATVWFTVGCFLIAPTVAYFAQEAKEVAAFGCLTTLQLWLYERWNVDPSRGKFWRLVFALMAGVLSYYFSLLIAFAFALHAAFTAKRRLAGIALIALPALVFAAWLPVFFVQMAHLQKLRFDGAGPDLAIALETLIVHPVMALLARQNLELLPHGCALALGVSMYALTLWSWWRCGWTSVVGWCWVTLIAVFFAGELLASTDFLRFTRYSYAILLCCTILWGRSLGGFLLSPIRPRAVFCLLVVIGFGSLSFWGLRHYFAATSKNQDIRVFAAAIAPYVDSNSKGLFAFGERFPKDWMPRFIWASLNNERSLKGAKVVFTGQLKPSAMAGAQRIISVAQTTLRQGSQEFAVHLRFLPGHALLRYSKSFKGIGLVEVFDLPDANALGSIEHGAQFGDTSGPGR